MELRIEKETKTRSKEQNFRVKEETINKLMFPSPIEICDEDKPEEIIGPFWIKNKEELIEKIQQHKPPRKTEVKETTYSLYIDDKLFKQLVLFEMNSKETMFEKWAWSKTVSGIEPSKEQELLIEFLLIAEEEIKVQIAEKISDLYQNIEPNERR